MPSNSTGTIAVNVDVSAYVPKANNFGGFYKFSPEDSTVRFRKLPANAAVTGIGLRLELPANPSDGDTYEFLDADGSCDLAHLVFVFPDPGGTATIGGQNGPGVPSPLTLFAFGEANGGARFQFDAAANQWIMWESVTPLFNALSNYIASGPQTPANFAGGAAINLAAFLVQPKGSGRFVLRAMLEFIAAAADAGVILDVVVIPDVTVFSGGAGVGPATAPTMRYETGTGAGQPVVVTGGAPVNFGEWKQQVQAALLTQTATLALDCTVPKPTVANALGAAIVITLADTAQVLSGLKFTGAVQEIN
jgi:hypothetical protein